MKVTISDNFDLKHWGLGACLCVGPDHVRFAIQLGPWDGEIYIVWGE
jgi:hypothetical protein